MRLSPPLLSTLAAALILSACSTPKAASAAETSPAVQPDRAQPWTSTWSFDTAPLKELPAGFVTGDGRWEVAALAAGEGRALAQREANGGMTFNVALAPKPQPADLDLSVRLRAEAGWVDQGGGPIWRAKDAKNYYVVRYNPLEDNFRVYKIIEGHRRKIGGASVSVDRKGWHTIGVTMVGDHIRCSLDGEPLLDVHDSSLPEAGKIGLWTKADAQTLFDDLRARPAAGPRR